MAFRERRGPWACEVQEAQSRAGVALSGLEGVSSCHQEVGWREAGEPSRQVSVRPTPATLHPTPGAPGALREV